MGPPLALNVTQAPARLAAVDKEIEHILTAIRAEILTPSTKSALEQAERERDRLLQAIQGPKKGPDQLSTLLPTLLSNFKKVLDDMAVVSQRELDKARGILRQLTARFDVVAAPDELVAATRRAIADATAFDQRDINRNFDYDDEAYREVKRNLGRLIASGQSRLAMQLALELMKRGSHQVEMSDEGMMTGDIEGCLSVVIQALTKCDLPADEVITWCTAMLDNDRVGFIVQEPLRSLRNHSRTTGKT